MPKAPQPNDEGKRIHSLRKLGILDSQPEPQFDEIVELASEIANTPVALISFVDEERQWFKAAVGLDTPETPRSQAFCAHTILTPEKPLIVEDATEDERFFDNPLVIEAPKIRFYAGFPIRSRLDNMAVGSLCVIDTTPKTLTTEQIRLLVKLSQIVERRLAVAAGVIDLDDAKTQSEFLSSAITKPVPVKPSAKAILGLWSISAVVFTTALLILASSLFIRVLGEQKIEADFYSQVNLIQTSLKENLISHEHSLQTIAAYLEKEANPTAEQFHQTIEKFKNSLPWAQAVYWVPMVTEQQRAQFEKQAQTLIDKEFAIRRWNDENGWQRQSRSWSSIYAPVKHVYPKPGNEHLMGIDLASRKEFANFLMRSSENGLPVSSAAVQLSNEEGNGDLLLIVPVYQNRQQQTDIREPRGDLHSLVVGVFQPDIVIDRLIERVKKQSKRSGILLKWSDVGVGKSSNSTIYQSEHFAAPTEYWFSKTESFEFGQRKWQLQWALAPEVANRKRSNYPWIIFWGGGALSIALGALLLRQQKAVRTAHKNSNQLLEQTKLLRANQATVNNSTEAIFWVNHQGRFIYCNRQACVWLGYSHDEILQMSINDINTAFQMENWNEFWEQSKREQVTTFEAIHTRKDGSQYDCEITKRFQEFDGVQFLLATVRDITERKDRERQLVQAKLAAEESESRFRRLADTAPALTWTTEVDSTCSWLNKRWLEYSGRSFSEQIGFGWLETVHNDDQSKVREIYQSAFENRKPFQLDYRLRRHDGEYRWHSVNAIPRLNEDGEFVGYIGMSIDNHNAQLAMTELAKSQQQLESTSDSLKGMLDLLSDVNGVWDWNVDSDEMKFTAGFRRMLGFSGDDFAAVPDKLESLNSRIYSDDLTRFWEEIELACNNAEPFVCEFRLKHRDGEYCWVRSQGQASHDNTGKAIRLVGAIHDITAQKQAEQKLAASKTTPTKKEDASIHDTDRSGGNPM